MEINNLNSNQASLPDIEYGIQCPYKKGAAIPKWDDPSCSLIEYKS